jgi:GGDEF domain-containing protein
VERVAALAAGSTLKTRARECCDNIRTEARQQEADWERTVSTLHREISRKEEAWRALGLDPAVEQPCEAIAQAQLLSALRSGGQEHIAVFVLDAARRINQRFGRVAGDEAIRALKQSLAAHLASSDPMFRWSDAAIVVSLAGESVERVQDRLQRLVEQPIEWTFEVNGRPVPVRLAVAWSFFTLSQPLAELNRRINDFVASRDREEEDV